MLAPDRMMRGHDRDPSDHSSLIMDQQGVIHMAMKPTQTWHITFQCQSLKQ